MSWNVKAEKWLSFKDLDQELKAQLLAVKNNEKEMEDRFYCDLEFGTGGMRGEMGPGTNRINIYTIRKATEGLAYYILEKGIHAINRGVVIAYDTRHKSSDFAKEAAKTLGKHGIKVYIFSDYRPTPELSFAVRHLNAIAGIVITASHNPPEYNGFKLYSEDGGQITPVIANQIIRYVHTVTNELSVEVIEEEEMLEKGLLIYVDEEIDSAYLTQLQTIQLNRERTEQVRPDLKIVFTPLHGTTYQIMQAGLKACGYENVTVVAEQARPDPNFSTVKSPNPEEHAAFELAICYGKEIDADILIGTDPDGDRLGVAVKTDTQEYSVLTGNQVGAIMLHYLLTEKKRQGILSDNSVVMKTIVTSELGRIIASDFGVSTIDTLTGFKYIGEKINELDQTGGGTFQFGFEESNGYLIGDFVRDKDAIQAAIFMCEITAFYKMQEESLYDALLMISEKYGYFTEELKSITLKGKNGSEEINRIMSFFRDLRPGKYEGLRIAAIEDYLKGYRMNDDQSEDALFLPKSDVLKFLLADESWICIRPSGTEPKIKFYIGVCGESAFQSKGKLEEIVNQWMSIIENIIK